MGKTKNTKPVRNSAKKKAKPPTRKRYTMEHKQQAIKLHKEGKSLTQIQKWFKDNLNMEVTKPTICTWYKPANLEKFAQMGELGGNNNDTCYNPSQRPRILIDLEQILVIHIKKSQLQGLPMSQLAIRLYALKMFQRIKSLDIYDNSGARRPDRVLSQGYIDYLLCYKPIESEITDVDNPHYEHPEDFTTNEDFVNQHDSDSVYKCNLCPKVMVNFHVFSKHVL